MGGWGQNWRQNILKPSTDVEVVASVDSDADMLALACERLDLPRDCCFESLQAALSVDADAVLITASLPAHVPVALAALNAGKHVLLEKPFAPSLAEAQQVVAAAEEHDRILM